LLHAVPLPNSHRAVFFGVVVDRDAQRGADLVLAPVALADGGGLVVVDIPALFQIFVDLARALGLAVLAHERQHRRLDRREAGVQAQHDPDLGLALGIGGLVFGVGVAQKRQRGAIGAGRGLDDVGDIALLLFVIEVRKLTFCVFAVFVG